MPTTKQYIEEAKLHLAANQTREAEEKLRLAIASDPGEVEARFELAKLLNSSERFEDCTRLIDEILKLVPDASERLTQRATDFLANNEHSIAIDLLTRALMIDPKNLNALINAGIALRETDRIDESESALRRALSINPRSVQALYELAHTLALKKAENEAMRLLLQSIKLQPSFTNSYLAIAGIYRDSDRLDDGIRICQQGLTANPDAFDIALLLKDLYREKGNIESAVELLEQICEEKKFKPPAEFLPERWKPQCELAELYSSLGRLDSAITLLEQACEIAPTEAVPRYYLGLVLAKADRLPEARQALLNTLNLAPADQLRQQISEVLEAIDREIN